MFMSSLSLTQCYNFTLIKTSFVFVNFLIIWFTIALPSLATFIPFLTEIPLYWVTETFFSGDDHEGKP